VNGSEGKAIHAKLTTRGTALMLRPEVPQMGLQNERLTK
jgi:hypothetical protein